MSIGNQCDIWGNKAMGVYFSELQGKVVHDRKGRKVGILKDMIFEDGEKEAKIVYLVLKQKRNNKLPIKYVDVVGKKIRLNKAKEDIITEKFEEDDITITRYILDKQIVDVDDLKVVRVSDVYLNMSHGHLVLHSVDIGTRGVMRRLGFTAKMFSRILRKKYVESRMRTLANLIPWAYVQPLHSNVSKLNPF